MKSKKTKIILVIAVVLIALVGIFGRDKFVAFAQSVIDSFSDTSKVDDTWNVAVDTGTGEVKLAEKTCDDGTWFCGAGFDDVCVDTLGDGDYVVVKRANEATTKTWKTTATDCDLPECGQDGAQNGDNLTADNTVGFALYPARQACKDAGGRLPTKEELQCIYTNRATFGDNFGTGNFWSGTEYGTTYAWVVYFSTGGTGSGNKATSGYVRCVQGW
ncbi:MAG: hypothetical protein UR69_C0003G0002 [Candidatus Moranbacteria bacterium GW2011_GWE2_35_2-]|nr:MAG: hypothetical protein UR69_C0003G0002 [Candidatus Moranbacteria bacterium GW2011_GWE2_35_2-]KKQ21770.1 MAG: hypothetical protein US37_C0008G0011 [Candidatus Moranbacteria bacterium GW2011_GWF2_37_11]KKQ31210.1 MAG: hypothetical protein US47_C0001G0444 [Candidatus Moranbacteria bacterium GW2011_GWE1_37_24]